MRKSYILAFAIAVIAAGWVLSGEFGDKIGLANGKTAPGEAPSVAERMTEQGEAALTAVRTEPSAAQDHWREVTARGHTEAKRSLLVKSEIKGRITDVAVKKGSRVRRGDVLVRIDVADRAARMAEAEALVRQREIEFQAARKLRKKGYRAETQFSAAAARLDAAKAMVKQMDVALSRTVIRAPFDAVVDSRAVELGAYVKDGSAIALLVDEDPYLVVAQISENDVGRLRRSSKGSATLVTGEKVTGRIHFIAATADDATRTFRVELLVPNPDGRLRHGTSAELHLPTDRVQAHFITPAVLTLNDSGTVGVRCVEAGGKVGFYPVEIIDSGADGVWVSGLPRQVELIVVGQEFVRQGDKVRVSRDGKDDGAKTSGAKANGASAS
ncbi:MAG: efflux RND transporter periplasmic adaptor subunit [Alphaproteobacteria bacterium]|nr:efflux RND transporter periplasmic adaptor subunit [Alphaproteobacteria bacterium]